MLTQEIIRELLDYDPETGRLFWKKRDRKWFKTDRSFKIWNTKNFGKEAFTCVNACDYLVSGIFGVKYYAHRIIWLYMTGSFPKEQIDHINHVTTDNRFCNLREATNQENSQNQSLHKNNKSGQTGVWKDEVYHKWRAYIRGKRISHFDTFEEAVAARKVAELNCGFHENHGKKE